MKSKTFTVKSNMLEGLEKRKYFRRVRGPLKIQQQQQNTVGLKRRRRKKGRRSEESEQESHL
jgi:hypothetical protein